MRNWKAGYSLFEVLVAFAIMSLVLSALLPGQTRLLQRVGTADEQALATDYANSLASLAAVTHVSQWHDDVFDYRNWRVEITVHQEAGSLLRNRTRVSGKDGRVLAEAESLGQTK